MSLHLSSPPGFERSPDSRDLQEELQAQALCHHLFRNRSIDLSATHGVVILQGEVQSYYEKQLAQEVVRRIVGVERVENQIEVAYD